MANLFHKYTPLYFIMLVLPFIYSCENRQKSVSLDNLIVDKWQMVEYAGDSVNTLDTLSFYKNGKTATQLKQVKLPTTL